MPASKSKNDLRDCAVAGEIGFFTSLELLLVVILSEVLTV
jgi:hypothetical protein